MYHVRERLTRKAYKHEICSSINSMMVEALKLASDHFKFAEIIHDQDMNKYEKLNDSIYLQILNSENDELRQSRDILKRVEKRKLYKHVGSCVIPPNNNQKSLENKLLSYMKKKSDDIEDENINIEVNRFKNHEEKFI